MNFPCINVIPNDRQADEECLRIDPNDYSLIDVSPEFVKTKVIITKV